jgi:signal transduction histidine kinase
MNCLPPLGRNTHRWVVPLWGSTAQQLIAALLARDVEARRTVLRELLTSDPAMLLWTVCTAEARDASPLDTIEKCADWLAEQNLAERLVGCELQHDGIEAGSYLPLLASSLGSKRDEVPEVLANTQQWMTLGGVSEKHLPKCVPDWLAEALAQANTAIDATNSSQTEAQQRITSDQTAAEQLVALVEQLARLEQLESHFDATLLQAKLDSMKELAYGAGHELNNPLANISTRAQVLLRDESNPERRRKLAAINAQAFRGHEMIADLMLYARPPKMSPKSIDLDALLATAMSETQKLAQERRIDLARVGQTEAIHITVDENQLMVALTAMIKNAAEVLGMGGKIELELALASDAAAGDCAEISIRDNGPGIEPNVLAHMFDPFYSGREAGRGLGFGLSKAWRIITNHGGTILVDSQLGRGATFTIRLPLAEPEVIEQ